MSTRKLLLIRASHSGDDQLTIKYAMPQHDSSGRNKWVIELDQLSISYESRMAVKGQPLSDFVVEFTPAITEHMAQAEEWDLFIDGSSTATRPGVEIFLVNPE